MQFEPLPRNSPFRVDTHPWLPIDYSYGRWKGHTTDYPVSSSRFVGLACLGAHCSPTPGAASVRRFLVGLRSTARSLSPPTPTCSLFDARRFAAARPCGCHGRWWLRGSNRAADSPCVARPALPAPTTLHMPPGQGPKARGPGDSSVALLIAIPTSGPAPYRGSGPSVVETGRLSGVVTRIMPIFLG